MVFLLYGLPVAVKLHTLYQFEGELFVCSETVRTTL